MKKPFFKKIRLLLLVGLVVVLAGCTTQKSSIKSNWVKDWNEIIETNNIGAVKRFIFIRVNFDLKCAPGIDCKPLGMAAKKGRVEIMKLLIEAGAGTNTRYLGGNTPLHYAYGSASDKRDEATQLLFDKGAEPGLVNCAGISPFYEFVKAGDARFVKLSIEKGADINTFYVGRKTDDGCGESYKAPPETTPLILAIEERKIEVAKLLIESGADTRLKDGAGNDALFYARKVGAAELVALIFK